MIKKLLGLLTEKLLLSNKASMITELDIEADGGQRI